MPPDATTSSPAACPMKRQTRLATTDGQAAMRNASLRFSSLRCGDGSRDACSLMGLCIALPGHAQHSCSAAGLVSLSTLVRQVSMPGANTSPVTAAPPPPLDH